MFISNVSGFWFVFPELTWMKTFKSYITHIILFLASTVTLFWNSWPPGQVDLTELILISADPTWLNKDKHYKRNKASVTPTVSTWRNVPAELHRDGLKTDNKMNLECFYFETIKTKRKWSFKIKGPSVLVEAPGESLWSMMLLLIRTLTCFDPIWIEILSNLNESFSFLTSRSLLRVKAVGGATGGDHTWSVSAAIPAQHPIRQQNIRVGWWSVSLCDPLWGRTSPELTGYHDDAVCSVRTMASLFSSASAVNTVCPCSEH